MKRIYIASHIGSCQLVRVIFPLALAILVPALPVLSAITEFQSDAWNSDVPHIYRNGQPVISSGQASGQMDLDGVPYFSTEETYEDLAFAFNGAAAGNPETQNKQIHQHLVAYTMPGTSEPFYHLDNTTGYTITYLLTKEDLLEMGFEPRKSISVRSNVILDGTLALARKSQEDDFSGLLASFDIVVSRIYDDKIIRKGPRKGEPVEKVLFKGSIKLTGTKKGKIAVTSTGKISQRTISDFSNKLKKELKEPGTFYEIAFNEVRIPYKTKIILGEEYKIKTQVTSSVTTRGDGTGAEVFFGTGEGSLEFLQESLLPAEVDNIDLDNLDWSIQILIDQSETVFDDPQFTRPRDNRGLAISPDGGTLYAGYNNSLYEGGEVRRIDLSLSGNVEPFLSRVTGVRGKSIAVDDVGRVYLAEGATIQIYDPNLSTLLYTISDLTTTEGVAVTRQEGQLVLYNSDRTNGTLEKRILSEDGAGISSVMPDGSFGANGVITLTGNLRGVEIDNQGRVWVAGFGTNTLYRVSADGATVDSLSVENPIDIGFDGQVVLVTRYIDRLISRFDADSLTSLGSDLTVTWEELGLDSGEQNSDGALSGIVVIPGEGFYVAHEAGQTLPFEEPPGSEYYIDDNDPILFAVDGNN
jgi:DNA-binding beta-propeller fold protein YncE